MNTALEALTREGAIPGTTTRRGGRATPPPKAGWRIGEWSGATGIGRAMTYILLNRGELESVKVGKMRIILTPPDVFLAAKAAKRQ